MAIRTRILCLILITVHRANVARLQVVQAMRTRPVSAGMTMLDDEQLVNTSSLIKNLEHVSNHNITSPAPTLLIAGVVSGALWLVSSISGTIYRLNRRNALKGVEKRGASEVEQERQETCVLLKSFYEGLQFQQHCLEVLLGGFAGEKMKEKLLDPDATDIPETWQPWRSIMTTIERQLQMLYQAIGFGSDLCQAEQSTMPILKLTAQRAESMPFPSGIVTATVLVIVAGTSQIEPAKDQQSQLIMHEKQQAVDFVSRFLGNSQGMPEEWPRSGHLLSSVNGERGRESWWTLNIARMKLLETLEDGSQVSFDLKSLGYVERDHMLNGRPCMKLSWSTVERVLCAVDEDRLQEWMTSLNYNRCRSSNMTTLARHGCEEHYEKIRFSQLRHRWNNLPPQPEVPQDWMELIWPQRALEAKVALRCEDTGACKVTGMVAAPRRKTGVLKLIQIRSGGHEEPGKNYYFLLWRDSLSWFDSIRTREARGIVLTQNLLIDKIEMVAERETKAGQLFCFIVEWFADQGRQVRKLCALTKEEATSWVSALRSAYADFFGGRQSLANHTFSRGLRALVGSTNVKNCNWQDVEVDLQRDRMQVNYVTPFEVVVGQTIENEGMWLFASLATSQKKIGTLEEAPLIPEKCRDTEQSKLPMWARCFTFESDGVLFDKGKYAICGEEDPHLWTVLPDFLAQYDREESPAINPRDQEAAWGRSLMQNPLESSRVQDILNMILEQLPSAQRSGQAVLCPPSCACPLYSINMELPDVATSSEGRAQFEIRHCRSEPAQIRNVEFRGGTRSQTMLELRFRGHTVLEDNPSAQVLADSAYPLDSNLANYLNDRLEEESFGVTDVKENASSASDKETGEEQSSNISNLSNPGKPGAGSGTCDAAELADILRLLWRFHYHRNSETLSQAIPRQQGHDQKSLVVLVLIPLVRQYLREVSVYLNQDVRSMEREIQATHKNRKLLASCDSAVLWQALAQVEEEEMQVIEFFGSAAQTLAKRNLNFHQHRLEASRSMLVASEFWRSMYEHGCSPNELWHPLERACYSFCLGKSTCTAWKQQERQSSEKCYWRSKVVPPSEGHCQSVCQAVFPGHPGCELGDPSGLPQAVEDFYKYTQPNALSLTKLILYNVPGYVLPAAQFFIQYPAWVYQSFNSNAFMYGLNKLFGITSMNTAIATGLTTLVHTVSISVGMTISLASFLAEVYGIYKTNREYKQTKNYFNSELQEKLREMRFVKCKLLLSMKSMTREAQDPESVGNGLMHDIIESLTHATKSPDSLEDIVSQICAGPLPAALSAAACESGFPKSMDPLDPLGGGTNISENYSSMFEGLLAVDPFHGLEEEFEECELQFPSSRHGRHPLPVSSIQALWLQRLRSEEKGIAESLIQDVSRRSNIDFEAIPVDTKPGQTASVDIKLGVTEPLQTVLLAERDPAAPPIIQLVAYHVPQPKTWNARAELSTPSKEEYDMSVKSSMNGETPVGLAGASQCDDVGARRCLFTERVGNGAGYADTLRAGGFVDLNMGCSGHATVGRNDSFIFGGGEVEVLLATKSGYELPPIIDARISGEAFSSDLAAQGFVRTAEDLNKECCAGFLNKKSYLYFRRQWVMRPSYGETIMDAGRIKDEVEKCLAAEQEWVPMSPHSMAESRRCLRCNCIFDDSGRCRALGLLDVYTDMYVVDEKLIRHRQVYMGELLIERLPGDMAWTEQAITYFNCEAQGVGQLWSVHQTRLTAEEREAADYNGAQQISRDFVHPEPLMEEGDSDWKTVPDANDFYFIGEVHQFGDMELFEQHRNVPASSATTQVCQHWKSKLQFLSQSGTERIDVRNYEFQACLERELKIVDATLGLELQDEKNMERSIAHCFDRRPFSKAYLQQSLGGMLEPLLLATDNDTAPTTVGGAPLAERLIHYAMGLATNYAHQFHSRVIREERSCRSGKDEPGHFGFREYLPNRAFKNEWARRKVSLTGVYLMATSCAHNTVQTLSLTDAVLANEFELADFGLGPFGCFTLQARDLSIEGGSNNSQGNHKSVKLCAPHEMARDWFDVIGQAIIDIEVGPFSSTHTWLNAAVKLRCSDNVEQALPHDIKPKLDYRPLPDGFGIKYLQGSETPAARGKFARGLLVGVGETRAAKGLTIGQFQRGELLFGSSVVHDDVGTHGRSIRAVFENALMVFTGYWLLMSERTNQETQRAPAHLGVLRDSTLRPLYWGQFGMWLPFGLGVWCDHEQMTMFRGVLKKEYISFKVGSTEAQFVPLLLGELTRMTYDIPIPDSEVLKLDPGKMPSALLHTAGLYFSHATPVATGKQEIVCRSKAFFQWENVLAYWRRLEGVWKAIAAGMEFNFVGLSIDAQEDDLNRPGLDVDTVLSNHVGMLVRFRRHLKELTGADKDEADQRLKEAVEVLIEAASKDEDFGEWDQHWMDKLSDKPQLLFTAQKLQALGPKAYMQFSSISSLIKGLDATLDLVTTSYCMMCFDKVEDDSPRSRGSPTKYAKVEVLVSRVRGLVGDQLKKAKVKLEVNIRDETGGTKSASYENRNKPQRVEQGEVRWAREEEFTFDGAKRRLQASTWLELRLLVELSVDGKSKAFIEVAKWKDRLVSIIGRRGQFEWLQLTAVGNHSSIVMAKDVPLKVRVALKVENAASILGFHSRQNVIPEGCGSTYAVRRLVERNEQRLRNVEMQTQNLEREAGQLASNVDENHFEAHTHSDPRQEKLVPDPARDPPRPGIEGSMHEDVFDGIFTADGPSVTLYTEQHSQSHQFHQGPQFFGEYVRLSNQATYWSSDASDS